MRKVHRLLRLPLLLLGLASAAAGQGILTVSPGRTASTTAGTGTVGYSGDNGAAAASTLAAPSAVATDAAGNVYLADTGNQAIRRIGVDGTMTTVAGTGIAGFSGDGGAATAAQLDSPTGVALDSGGALYIADTHNGRVRRVSNGTITTIAGNGAAGFAGDGGAATAASLSSPSGVAVDAAGNLYIADTGNQRVRRVTAAGVIATVAGNGDQGFSGDGGAATAASLDSPYAVAVDAAGAIYVADRHNHRIRAVAASGTITTLAGSGAPAFAGGFGGDGGPAGAAALYRPSGVSLDSAGNVYVVDTENQRVRQVGNGGIRTVYGSGDQAPGADALNTARGISATGNGNLTIADTLNQRIVADTQTTLSFAPQGVGTASPAQTVTLGNSGNAPLTLTSLATSANFSIVAGGSCPAAPVTLAPGGSCTVNVTYTQSMGGSTSGSLSMGGTNIPSQSVLLAVAGSTLGGNTVQTATVTSIVTSQSAPTVGQPVTYTIRVAAVNGVGSPTGSVVLTANGASLGVATLYAGLAQLTTSFATSTAQTVVATYSGDTYYAASSGSYQQTVDSFTFAPAAGSSGSYSLTVVPGNTGTYTFSVAPANGPFPYPITFSATGAPAGATITFTPGTVTLGTTAATVNMAVKVPVTVAAMHAAPVRAVALAVALLVLPFGLRNRKGRRSLLLVLFAGAGFGALGGLAGCGSTSTGFFSQTARTYNIVVTATATTPSGSTLQQSVTVVMVVS